MSTFHIFPNFGRGGGVIENQFFPKFKIDHIILGGGGGQENYGLFPQFVTFSFWKAPLNRILETFCHLYVTLFRSRFTDNI